MQDARALGSSGILGVHLEGPFLSHDKPSIHDPNAIRNMDGEDLDQLTSVDMGVMLLTVAPENLPNEAQARLNAADVRVFAGHTNATADQIETAEEQGLVGVTHLFNAMSQITVREPDVEGAAFTSRSLFAGTIADGHHVDWRNVGSAVRLMPDRLCLVTDAMLTLAGELTSFDLHGVRITYLIGMLSNAKGGWQAHISA